MKLWPLLLLGLGGLALWKTTESSRWALVKMQEREGGGVWAPSGSAPAFEGFDFAGNGLRLDTRCEAVAEGGAFLPFDGDHPAEPRETLAATLALSGNTGRGFLVYLMESEGITDPLVASARILEETSPQCAAVSDDTWSDAMRSWYGEVVKRVSAFMSRQQGAA